MSTTTATTTRTTTTADGVAEEKPIPPRLDDRFAALKQEIIKNVDPKKLQDSYERLKVELTGEVERLEKLQQDAVPEVKWGDVVAYGEYPPTVLEVYEGGG